MLACRVRDESDHTQKFKSRKHFTKEVARVKCKTESPTRKKKGGANEARRRRKTEREGNGKQENGTTKDENDMK